MAAILLAAYSKFISFDGNYSSWMKILLKFISHVLIDNIASGNGLVPDKSLTESMMTQFTDAYVHHLGFSELNHGNLTIQ